MQAGKGDKDHTTDFKAYRNGYDNINFKKKTSLLSERLSKKMETLAQYKPELNYERISELRKFLSNSNGAAKKKCDNNFKNKHNKTPEPGFFVYSRAVSNALKMFKLFKRKR